MKATIILRDPNGIAFSRLLLESDGERIRVEAPMNGPPYGERYLTEGDELELTWPWAVTPALSDIANASGWESAPIDNTAGKILTVAEYDPPPTVGNGEVLRHSADGTRYEVVRDGTVIASGRIVRAERKATTS